MSIAIRSIVLNIEVIKGFFVRPIHLNRIVIITLLVLIGSLLLDVSLVKISDLIRVNVNYSLMVPLFVILVTISIFSQHMILRLREVNGKEIMQGAITPRIFRITRILQHLLIFLVAIVIIQVLFLGRYSNIVLFLTTMISYGMSVTVLALLAKRFVVWFKAARNFVVLAYGISAITLMMNAAITVMLVTVIWLETPIDIGKHVANLTRIIVAESPAYLLNQVYFVTSIAAFVSTWFATVLLLRHYSVKLGKMKYWILVSLPLVYFIIQFPPLVLEVFRPLLISNPMLFSILVTLTFAISKPVGGVLFALAFFFLAKSLPPESVVRRYVVISAFGLILLFLSNQALIWIYVPYPPFGIATIPFMGLCSYLFFVGISSSALSVAHDSKLRGEIRRYAITQSQLLDSIGTAEMEKETLNRALFMTKSLQDNMTKETGIESSVNENDMKDYLYKVMKEIKRMKEETNR